MKDIAWVKSDEPKKPGTYLVAVEYNNGMGACISSHWNPAEGWFGLGEGERVIAHINIEDIVRALPSPWDD